MKQYILILIGILCLQSCVVTKSIKYGNASVDDYSVFEQYTVARGLRTFGFADAQQKSPLIDTLKFDIYFSKFPMEGVSIEPNHEVKQTVTDFFDDKDTAIEYVFNELI